MPRARITSPEAFKAEVMKIVLDAELAHHETIGAVRRRLQSGDPETVDFIAARRDPSLRERLRAEQAMAAQKAMQAKVEGIRARLEFERKYPSPEVYRQQLLDADRMDYTEPNFWTEQKLDIVVKGHAEMRDAITPAFEALGGHQSRNNLHRLEMAYASQGSAGVLRELESILMSDVATAIS